MSLLNPSLAGFDSGGDSLTQGRSAERNRRSFRLSLFTGRLPV